VRIDVRVDRCASVERWRRQYCSSEDSVRIDVRVDRCVCVDRWRRLYSSAYVVTGNHVTSIGAS
jgi:hypothetical protein